MSVNAIGFLPPLQEISLAPQSLQATAAGGTGFADWIARETAAASGKLVNAERNLQRLAAGDTSNLHQTMIALEDARLTFQLFVQVRNHLLDGYQEILRMQV
jgi:flagellar hook-basal body complex protein FliE